jgi:hypothetical protein
VCVECEQRLFSVSAEVLAFIFSRKTSRSVDLVVNLIRAVEKWRSFVIFHSILVAETKQKLVKDVTGDQKLVRKLHCLLYKMMI